jgi:1,4-alpha-glucan branching enzyme
MAKKLGIIEDDGWLEPYEKEINDRFRYFNDKLTQIREKYGSLLKFASVDSNLGLIYDKKKKGWYYREWAPEAEGLFLVGDFNNWDPEGHPLKRDESGIWEIFLKDTEDGPVLQHEQRLKVRVVARGQSRDRIPALIKRAVQDEKSNDFSGQIWDPPKKFKWTDKEFNLGMIGAPVIYELHPGMAQEKEGIGTYRELADNVLPRIKKLGYNYIQTMAIQEHPYYGSFGYHVSNFFAPSSRFGTPEDLKYFINKAHKEGIAVIMDIVHSHAVKNIAEGLNDFDGSDNQYFHHGGKGYHTGWDSKLFDYGKEEVMAFLLSNVRYWLDEFHFDGFRFDGVTSMLYEHHGDHVSFDHYDKYFRQMVDWDAICYLQLANEVIHSVKPNAISIAEDMSGMPGLCQPVKRGGMGFDYRLGMGIPDYWIKLLKHSRDEDWNIHEMWDVLSNRRFREKTIAYSESHDQALVGDKTIAFWLMDKEMYWHMSKGDNHVVIERGIAIHKMLRLFSASLGGEGYLNFIGNEFGHPEWIDFPREGNGWSYKYARRQWSLVDNQDLKYHYLNDFDEAMVKMLRREKVLDSLPARQLNMDENNKVIIFERNNLIFLFNFNVSFSIPDYRFYIPESGTYQVLLNSDEGRFGGHDRVDMESEYLSFHDEEQDINRLSVYLPNRTALVLKKQPKKRGA